LDNTAPAAPTVTVSTVGSNLRVSIAPDGGDALSWFLVRWRTNGTWSQKTLPVVSRSVDVVAAGVDGVVVNAIDRVGNASADAVWRP
jgi:hypothetical protein